MRSLAILGAASMLALLSATEGGAATLCVDPDDAGCLATIQAAVDAASPGDTISIREKADGSAYSEAVTIATPDLTIQGEDAPTFRSVASMIEFSRLSTVDLDDPDVGLWLDNYPDSQDFLDALATLEDFIQEETLIDQCPGVVVEVCETPETGPGFCGKEDGVNVDVFTVEASGTSFADLTIRHGALGIFVNNVTDTTVERVCFRDNNEALRTELDFDPVTFDPIPSNHRTEIRQSFVDGPAIFGGFSIFGDDAVIERNLLLNAEGIFVFGNGYQVSFNALAVTTDSDCILAVGADGLVRGNVNLSCDGGLELFNAVDTTVIGNLIQGTTGGDDGILGFGVPGFDEGEPGNLRTVVKNNIVRLISDDGIELGASEAVIEGNLIERAASDDVGEAGLDVAGIDNQILHNLIRFSSRSAITLNGFFNFDTGEFVPATGNLIQGNLLTRNHTAGIHLPAGGDFGAGPVPRIDGTTIDDNIITITDGEGVAIPDGAFDPPNEPAASDTTITNNTFRNNRTDICDESDSTVIGAGNGSPSVSAECVVEPGVDLDF